MTDIDKARAAKLKGQFSQAGWSPNADGIASNPLRFWIYSCSLERGPRLVTQLGAEFHRDLVANTGPIKALLKEFPKPWEALADMLALFDAETDVGRQDEHLRQHDHGVLRQEYTDLECGAATERGVRHSLHHSGLAGS